MYPPYTYLVSNEAQTYLILSLNLTKANQAAEPLYPWLNPQGLNEGSQYAVNCRRPHVSLANPVKSNVSTLSQLLRKAIAATC